ncbi:MAG: hypothetical protein OWS74_09275 [Firmicutes bacterium]|nr:hypothetical protein [Bacillota bacterium]
MAAASRRLAPVSWHRLVRREVRRVLQEPEIIEQLKKMEATRHTQIGRTSAPSQDFFQERWTASALQQALQANLEELTEVLRESEQIAQNIQRVLSSD